MKYTITLLTFFTICFSVFAQEDGTIDESFLPDNTGRKGAQGPTYDFVEQTDGKVIIVGQFNSYNQKERRSLVRINEDGSMDEAFNQTNFFVGGTSGSAPLITAVAIQPDGKIIVGGNFLANNGFPDFDLVAEDIIRLNSDGTVDQSFIAPTDATPCGDIQDIVIQPDGKIIIVGNISFCLGSTIDNNENILRLNSDGSIDDTFQVEVNGFTIEKAILQPDGKIIVAGIFSNVNGEAREGIARINSDGTLDITFTVGSGFDDDVNSIALQQDGKIIAVGDFDSYNGISQGKIVRLNTDGSLDNSFITGVATQRYFPSVDASFESDIESVAIQSDGKILIGGNFNRYDGQVISKVARLNSDGSLDTDFNNIDDQGFSTGDVFTLLEKSNGKIIVGGAFQYLKQRRKSRIAQLNSDGSIDTNFNKTFGPSEGYSNTFINTIKPIDNNGYVLVGQFREYDDQFSRNIAKINSSGTKDLSFSTGTDIFNGFDDDVNDFAIQPDGKIIVVGDFENYNQIPAGGIIRLNADGSVDNSFNPGSGVDTAGSASIRSVALKPDGKILIGGFFVQYNGTPFVFFGGLNSDGSIDNSFDTGTGASDPVEFIHATQNNNQYIISGPNTYNDVSSSGRLFRINSDGTLDSSFDVTAYTSGSTRDIAELNNGQMYIGGFFSLGFGNGLSPILRLNSDGSLDTSFNTTDIMFSTFTMGEVNAIEVQADEKVIIGGRFMEIEGRTIRGLARLNNDGSLDDTFNPEVPAQDPETYEGLNDQSLTQIYDMYLEPSGRLIIAGNFGTYNGEIKMPLMAVFADTPLTLSTSSFDETFKSVKVYPNPVNEAFSISGLRDLTKVDVIDYSGKLLYTYDNITTTSFTISTENFSKGMYLLKISTQGSEVIKKLIIN